MSVSSHPNLVDIARVRDAYRRGVPAFRNGFVVVRRGQEIFNSTSFARMIADRFICLKTDHYDIWHDPATSVLDITEGSTRVIAIGEIYDNRGGNVSEVLRSLCGADFIDAVGRQDLGGRFGAVVLRASELYAFSDAIGSRRLFYAEAGICVATHPSLLRFAIDCPLDKAILDQMSKPHFQQRVTKCLPGDLTVYRGVYAIPPNHVYSSRFNAPARFWPYGKMGTGSVDRVYELMDRSFAALRTHLAGRRLPVIAVTGGGDTRCIVSNFADAGVEFQTMTWRNLNFDPAEGRIVERITSLLGDRLHHDIWSSDEADADPTLELAGRYNAGLVQTNARRTMLMRACADKIAATGEDREPIFVMGYGGEIVRGFYMLDGRPRDEPFLAHTMGGLYGHTSRKHVADPDYTRFVIDAFRRYWGKAMYAPDFLHGRDPFDMFYWEHRMGMWGAATQDTIDVALPCLTGINSRDVFDEAIRLPESARLSKQIMIDYTAARSPEFGKIPTV